ncbi:hypothetical protein B0H13DRAFT_2580720 [Mycena leptocephala]|nr:hypothetical protein B0H13DRAFT_2580720 [Mycena leptocephala]
MPTFKVVVIGASGVGKTSLRARYLQYISSRFSTSYRATIGADFITKTLPPPASSPDAEPVTLQIWDTAAKSAFPPSRARSSAVRTLREFKEKAPVAEEDLRGFCVTGGGRDVVSPAQGADSCVRCTAPGYAPAVARAVRLSLILSADEEDEDEDADDALASSELTARPPPVSQAHQTPPSPISILRHPHLAPSPTTPSHNRHTNPTPRSPSPPPSPVGSTQPLAFAEPNPRGRGLARFYHNVDVDGVPHAEQQLIVPRVVCVCTGHGRGDSDSTVHSDSTLHSNSNPNSNSNSNSNSNTHSHSNSQTGVGAEYPHALGNGLPTALASRLHANATITPARFSSASSASSTHSSTDSFPLSSSPSPPPPAHPGLALARFVRRYDYDYDVRI